MVSPTDHICRTVTRAVLSLFFQPANIVFTVKQDLNEFRLMDLEPKGFRLDPEETKLTAI